MRTAFFGGTFDPPHNGHFMIASEILGRELADLVLFVPAFVPPHKPGLPVSDFRHRMKMLELAISHSEDERLRVSDMELRLGRRPSYTFDILEALENEGGWGDILLVVGGDSLLSLHTWMRADEIAERWSLIAYPRPGYPCGKAELSPFWPPATIRKLLSSIVAMPHESGLASTDLRCKISRDEDVSGLLPGNVLEYIREKGLYKGSLNPER